MAGAPECYRGADFMMKTTKAVGQSVDIWSLGCVFSEVAQWMNHGRSGLLQYRESRKLATKSLKDVGCFHDGQNVLECVEATHRNVFINRRKSDYMTRPILKKLVEEMLYEHRGRPSAEQLVVKIKNIREDVKKTRENGDLQPITSISRSTTATSDAMDFQPRRRPSNSVKPQLSVHDQPQVGGVSLTRTISRESRSSTMPDLGVSPPKIQSALHATVTEHRRRKASQETHGSVQPRSNALLEDASQPQSARLSETHENVSSPTTSEPMTTIAVSNNSRHRGSEATVSTSKSKLPYISMNEVMQSIIERHYQLRTETWEETKKWLKDLGKRDHVSKPRCHEEGRS